jgi:CO/xanthine dehydrogenase FAD-binding subunit
MWLARAMDVFAYHRPLSLEEARAALARDGARILAGGTDLIPQMREGRRSAAHLVDLKHLDECASITARKDGGLAIGAALSASRVAWDANVSARYPALAAAARMIGSDQVQNRASLGGNICNAAPSADAVPPLIAYGARVEIAGAAGLREEALEAIFLGPGRTSLAAGEFVTCILLPPPPPQSAAHYLRFTPRREMDIAVAGVAARVVCDASGRVSEARIALASVAPTPIRAPGGEAALIGKPLDDETIAAAAPPTIAASWSRC